MSRLGFVLAAACGAGAATPAIAPVTASTDVMMSDVALGPLTPKTRANLVALRAALVGYEVVPVNAPALEFHVRERGKPVLVIIPDGDGDIREVHVSSLRIGVAGRSWRVGAKLSDASALTACECVRDKPLCFAKGEHVGVAFNRTCGSVDSTRARMRLAGAPIAGLVWSPTPLGRDTPAVEDVDVDLDPCAGP